MCLQVFFKHCFSSSFSLHFCPTAGDTIMCPCSDASSDPGDPIYLLAGNLGSPCLVQDAANPTFAHQDPSPGFVHLMEEYLGPEPPTQPMHTGREVSAHPSLMRKIHSPEHVLLECPLTAPFRYIIQDSILGTVNIHNIFYTIKGVKSLTTFLLHSNSLLCPLPPCPDPP